MYLKALSALSVDLVVTGCRCPADVEDVPVAEPAKEAAAEPTKQPIAKKRLGPDPIDVEPLAPGSKPHVLFISIDDLNDWVGALGGHPQTLTPNIDALARAGMLFANAHACAPSCNGSRTATMTGLRPSTTGIYGNPQPWRQHLAKAITLPSYFRRAGYRVIGTGKLFHGPYPDPQAWDEFHPSLCDQRPKEHLGISKEKKPLHGIRGLGHFDWGPVEQPDTALSDAKVVDWAIGHMPGADAQPTFLACGIFRPHLPWYVPQKWFDKFPLQSIKLPKVHPDDRDDLPRAALRRLTQDDDHEKIVEHDKWEAAVQAYLASIAFADEQVGRLVAALKQSPAADNTIVVLWSDHGWHLGEKLKWRKFSLWERATHVPLVFAGPGVGKPGGVCRRPVSLLDLYPTLVELCGLPPRKGLEGMSLKPLLERPDAEWQSDAITTWGRGNHAIRTERWRYIRYKGGTQELYDHTNDPEEWTNLAGDPTHAALMAKLAERLPQRNAAVARRKKLYDKADLDCDPDLYNEDEDNEEEEATDEEQPGGSPASTSPAVGADASDPPKGGAPGASDAPG